MTETTYEGRDLLAIYQEFTPTTAIYGPEVEGDYITAGLVGEIGEIYSLMAKYHRDGMDYEVFRDKLKSELGDVMWFITQMANYYKFDMQDIVMSNMSKLIDRQERNVIGGSGDDR